MSSLQHGKGIYFALFKRLPLFLRNLDQVVFHLSSKVFTNCIWDWIHSFYTTRATKRESNSDITFLCTMWWCWRFKNNFIIDNANLSSFVVCRCINSLIETCIKGFFFFWSFQYDYSQREACSVEEGGSRFFVDQYKLKLSWEHKAYKLWWVDSRWAWQMDYWLFWSIWESPLSCTLSLQLSVKAWNILSISCSLDKERWHVHSRFLSSH